ncbi:DUF6279 family lipoprotein [Ramlibacter tataouinensis]|uniref:DUF6279 family lipoprotein n=1 Tax=Ramlibacter tataouinensis TaxID=94132 RepID=UPI0022F3A5CD|nr:DUF6279 family lipoprotein [Ramlibacter tataouinensis]WBY03606.1 DUF6279 family lipoprotein [Ramlibacter tataouinensis]
MSLALALAACSTLKLGYNALPEVAYWWLARYVDFEGEQGRHVREDLHRLLAWHRGAELPRIAALLQRIEQQAGADTTAERVCAFEGDLRERFLALRNQAEPMIAAHALTLSAAQLQHLERRYERINRDYERDWLHLSAGEQVDKRLKQMRERAERFYGHLGERQLAALRQQLERSAFSPALFHAERQRRQQDTLAVLRRLTAQPPEQARTAVHGLLERFGASPDPAWRAWQQVAAQETCRQVAALHNATTPEQREHAARRLRSWQHDLAELAADRP